MISQCGQKHRHCPCISFSQKLTESSVNGPFSIHIESKRACCRSGDFLARFSDFSVFFIATLFLKSNAAADTLLPTTPGSVSPSSNAVRRQCVDVGHVGQAVGHCSLQNWEFSYSDILAKLSTHEVPRNLIKHMWVH